MTVKPNDEERVSSAMDPDDATETANSAVDESSREQAEDTPNNESAKETAGSEAAQIASLLSQLAESQDRFARGQADFDNFRRRTRQEKEEFAKYASAKLIEQLLPVMDNFERAVSASQETKDFDSFFKGVDMIARQLTQVLEQEGLIKMETVGQPFNPEYHQALMQVESEEYEEGTIVEELVKGYMLKDKVLRPAMVKVSG
ncbi:nucleotide exchange factor GrpE [Gorillibacterium massiliense]|uniref:nucleotide exchange factor GrpE n=1 Tax=Gorillibacterium massiliense TaxID=1280390 RepID=UPI0004B36EA9|nr:nucleotide exchange factor GrpE [Gorillibacterium massiliense]